MRLYDYDARLQELIEQADPDTGEIPEEIWKEIDELTAGREEELEHWLEALAFAYQNQRAEAEAIKAEKLRLQSKQAAAENRSERIKQYMTEIMLRENVGKMKTPRGVTLSWRAATSVFVDDPKQIPPAYWIAQLPKLDQRALLADLRNGADVAGATLETKQHLQIK